MLFRKCSIGNAVYGEASDADNMDLKSRDIIKGLIFGQQTQQGQALKEFFTSLAVCHTCMVERDPKNELKYSASSPDELALVVGARDVGLVF